MENYYIKQAGRVTGPFTRDDIARRIDLNVVRSLDRISKDGVTWTFVKDSDFWRTDGDASGQIDMPFISSLASPDSPNPVPLPTRFRSM